MIQAFETVSVLGVPLTVAGPAAAANAVIEGAQSGSSAFGCAVCVGSTMWATRDPEIMRILRASDLNVPDGQPIVWAMRALGAPAQQRVSGPGLMWDVCGRAAEADVPVALYGSTDDILQALQATLAAAFPSLRIVAVISPPFRPLSGAEDAQVVHRLNASGARIVFVALGAPKQEKWMESHRGQVHAVMLGVGAAFDYHAGRIRRAPMWMQNAGLEWLYRLIQEPWTWRQNLYNNPPYLVLLGVQIVRERVLRRGPRGRQSDIDR